MLHFPFRGLSDEPPLPGGGSFRWRAQILGNSPKTAPALMIGMPRTDENGRYLQAVLSYELNRAVAASEMFRALKVARNTYTRRSQCDDFPDAEECRVIALHFELSPLALMTKFGLL